MNSFLELTSSLTHSCSERTLADLSFEEEYERQLVSLDLNATQLI